jgi:hypothetical protein
VALKAIEQAHAFGLGMVTLPSHISHKLHPLNVSYFKPFKTTFKTLQKKQCNDQK